ncbi:MAG TPA: hypothetical protein VFD46_04470 [Chryseolinea sp.]|nr:hypothetical protein [Chryseolinea sp.]
MTHEEKINYMRIAISLCKWGFENREIDLLVSLYDELLVKGGEMTMRDTAKIEVEVIERHKPKSPKFPTTTNPEP